MKEAEEILEQLIDELEDLPMGDHRPDGSCPRADPETGACDACAVLDDAIELVNAYRGRLERLRLGIGTVAA